MAVAPAVVAERTLPPDAPAGLAQLPPAGLAVTVGAVVSPGGAMVYASVATADRLPASSTARSFQVPLASTARGPS